MTTTDQAIHHAARLFVEALHGDKWPQIPAPEQAYRLEATVAGLRSALPALFPLATSEEVQGQLRSYALLRDFILESGQREAFSWWRKGREGRPA